MLTLLLACSPLPGNVPSGAEPGWTTLTPLPHPLQETAVVGRADGTVWVMGGFDGDRLATDAIWIFGSDHTWTAGPPLPEALHHVQAAEVDGELLLLGGLSGITFRPITTAWRLEGADWTPLPALPFGLGSAVTANTAAGVVLASGWTGQSSPASLRFAQGVWTALPDLPAARDHAAGGSDPFLLIGGRDDGIGNVRGEVWALENDVWQARTPMPTPRAGAPFATDALGRVIVAGGEGHPSNASGVFSEVERYDPTRDEWDTLPPLPLPVHGTGAAFFEGGLLVPGGADAEAFAAVDTVQWLDPQAD